MDKDNVPKYGFSVKLNHTFPERWKQFLKVRWNQIWELITLGIRYFFYWVYIKMKGRTPMMDYLHVQTGQQIYGVPIGGIGSGTIGRGFRGEFCRFQLRPGICRYKTIYGDQFIVSIHNVAGECVYQKVLSTAPRPKTLKSWDWSYNGENADYVGLYPRSWTVYRIPEQNIVIKCRQISPVIPHNYQDSCLPCAVFVWSIENNNAEERSVSIAFTFQNGIGESSDAAAGCWTESYVDDSVQGALIHHSVGDMPYTFAIAATKTAEVHSSVLCRWNPLGNGDEVWRPLYSNGCFEEQKTASPLPSTETKKGQLLGAAVCAQIQVPSGSAKSVEFALAWDMPTVHFGEGNKHYNRFYTKQFGTSGTAAAAIAKYAFMNRPLWDDAITAWQKPVLDDSTLPDWYKSALFNETYFVSDGGSVWLELGSEEVEKLPLDDPRRKYGRFAYLEGHEYRMFNTYDVHFYASFALAMNWPSLQAVIQRDFADTISREDSSLQWHLFDGDISVRKKKNTIPHDIGDPGEEPFIKINAYPIHEVSEWRDLNLKYVLQCYRDFSLTGDLVEIRCHWPHMLGLMKSALRWDKDGDGLIENHGCPDQTYDTWTMQGPSAYCGSLWLAALQVTIKTAKILQQEEEVAEFDKLHRRACAAFVDRLWNGRYFNFDCSNTDHQDTIMSDQLCGLWYLLSSGLNNTMVPKQHAEAALKIIYKYNVQGFAGGQSGAVNGMRPNGKVDLYTIQSEEVWCGVVYAVASLFLLHDMDKEAFITAEGLYKTVYERIGLGFETPEALYEKDCYRSIGYMRPLSIWSMQLAIELRKKMKNEGVGN